MDDIYDSSYLIYALTLFMGGGKRRGWEGERGGMGGGKRRGWEGERGGGERGKEEGWEGERGGEWERKEEGKRRGKGGYIIAFSTSNGVYYDV